MEILNFLFGSERRADPPAADNDFWYKNISTLSRGSYNFDADSAMRIATVFSCVRVVAEGVASLPLPLYRRLPEGGKEKATKDPLFKILRYRPNVWQTHFEFWEMLTGHVMLRGNAYAKKIFDNAGRLVQLLPLDPSRMGVGQKPTGELEYHYRLKNGLEIIYNQFEIMHLRGIGSDGLTGMSVVDCLARTFDASQAVEEFQIAFLKNFAKPGGVLTHPAKLTKEARENLKASWQQAHAGGADNAYKVAILEEGLKWEQVGMSQRDTELIAFGKMKASDICGAFRVPPHMVGILDKATFSNIEQQSGDFQENTLRPWLVRFEEAIMRDLIDEEKQDDFFAEFMMTGILRADTAARGNFYVLMVQNGIMNPDEIRSLENMNPIEDGSGKVYRVPLNTAPSTETEAQQEEEEEEEEEDQKSDSGLDSVARDAVMYELFSEAHKRAIRRELKSLPQMPGEIAKQKSFFIELLSPIVRCVALENAISCGYGHRLGEKTLTRLNNFLADSDAALTLRHKQEAQEVELIDFKPKQLWDIFKDELKKTKDGWEL